MEGLEDDFPDSLHTLGLYAGVAVLSGISFGVAMHAILASEHSHGDVEHDGDGHHHTQSTPNPLSHDQLSEAETAMSALSGDSPNAGSHDRGAIPAIRAAADSAAVVVDCSTETMRGTARGPTSPSFDGDSSSGESSVSDVGSPVTAKNLQHLMDTRKSRALFDIKGLQPVCWNVIVGDLAHNFADGITIGAAFLGCSSTIGWTVTASAVLHEIPHELADFMALMNGGMSVNQVRKLIHNFNVLVGGVR